MGESVGARAGFDDVAAEREPIHDRRTKPRIGERLRPTRERLVRSDGHGILLLPFRQHLKKGAPRLACRVPCNQVRPAKVDPLCRNGRSCELVLVGGLDEFVHQPGGEDVF